MHAYIVSIAAAAASREVNTLTDYYGLGQLVVSGELTYEGARDQLVEAFESYNLKASTAKVYLSQGYGLAQLFDTVQDLFDYADDELKGTRSLKGIYDAARKAGKADEAEAGEAGEAEAETVTAETTDADRAAAAIAILSGMSDAAAIASVRDAAIARLTLKVA